MSENWVNHFVHPSFNRFIYIEKIESSHLFNHLFKTRVKIDFSPIKFCGDFIQRQISNL